MAKGDKVYKCLNPVGIKVPVKTFPLAPRLDTLDGKEIYFSITGEPDLTIPLEKRLKADFPDTNWTVKKTYMTLPVPLTEEELPLSSLKAIQVDAFVKGIDDPRYFKDSYLLSPEEVGAKAFVLFLKAMEQAGVVGVAKIAIGEREQLCSIRPFNGLLLLQTLHWNDELRDYGEIIPFASVSDQEMQMAGKLIGGMTREVDLASYKDEYRRALAALISAKLEGKTIEAPKAPPKQDADLAKQLLASLNAITAK